MSTSASFAAPWTAVVVQAPIYGVTSDSTAREQQRENARRIARQIDRIVQSFDPTPRLIVYPVLCLTGPRRRHVPGLRMETVAIELPGETFQPILDACARNNCYFVSSTQEVVPKLPGRFFHTGFMFGPKGLVLRSPKAQAYSAPEVIPLRDLFDEYEALYGRGSVQPVAATELGTFGCLVETEINVVEAARVLRSKGAEIIVHPTAEHGDAVQAPPLALKQAAAFSTGTYLLSASISRLIGYEDDFAWLGGSTAIVGPDGTLDAYAGGKGDGIIAGQVDPARLIEARKRLEGTVTPAGVLYRDLYPR